MTKSILTPLFAGAFLSLSSLSGWGFTFPSTAQHVSGPSLQAGALDIPWSIATTQSWRLTGNTVWNHCVAVLTSHGVMVEVVDVVDCEKAVALANNRTKESFINLEIGEEIILPLTRWQELHYANSLTPAQVDELAQIKVQVRELAEKLAVNQPDIQVIEKLRQEISFALVTAGFATKEDLAGVERTANDNQVAIVALTEQVSSMRKLLESDTPDNASISKDEVQKLLASIRKELADELAKNPRSDSGQIATIKEALAAVSSVNDSLKDFDQQLKGENGVLSRLKNVEDKLRFSQGAPSLPWWQEIFSRWWLIPTLVFLGLVTLIMGVLLWLRGVRHEQMLGKQKHLLETHDARLDEVEDTVKYLVVQTAQGIFECPSLTDDTLNSLSGEEYLTLTITGVGNGVAHPKVKIYKGQGKDGEYLELVGVTKGQNIIDPLKRKDGTHFFTVAQVFKRLRSAVENKQIIGLVAASKKAA